MLLAVLAAACGASTGKGTRERAVLLVDKGQPEAALRVLREHVTQHPAAIEERRLIVRVLGITGDLASAEREAQVLAGLLGTQSAIPWLELGHAYELAHRYDEALALYDRAALAAPHDPAGPAEGGMRAARWGEVELAAPRLEEALRRNSADAKLWHALGVVRLRTRDFAGARLAYVSGLQADPQALENRVGLATLAILTENAREALVQYDAIITSRPRFADAHLGRSWALMQLGRYAEAELAIQRGVELGADLRAVRSQRRLLARLRMAKESN